jgi:hypothetical protein
VTRSFGCGPAWLITLRRHPDMLRHTNLDAGMRILRHTNQDSGMDRLRHANQDARMDRLKQTRMLGRRERTRAKFKAGMPRGVAQCK